MDITVVAIKYVLLRVSPFFTVFYSRFLLKIFGKKIVKISSVRKKCKRNYLIIFRRKDSV